MLLFDHKEHQEHKEKPFGNGGSAQIARFSGQLGSKSKSLLLYTGEARLLSDNLNLGTCRRRVCSFGQMQPATVCRSGVSPDDGIPGVAGQARGRFRASRPTLLLKGTSRGHTREGWHSTRHAACMVMSVSDKTREVTRRTAAGCRSTGSGKPCNGRSTTGRLPRLGYSCCDRFALLHVSPFQDPP